MADPAIQMMDKIIKRKKAERNKDLDYYNSLCGPVVITTKTKVTYNKTILKAGTK